MNIIIIYDGSKPKRDEIVDRFKYCFSACDPEFIVKQDEMCVHLVHGKTQVNFLPANENAGRCWRSDILLIPQSLKGSKFEQEVALPWSCGLVYYYETN